MNALIALEDGRCFPCRSFTGPGEICGEVVFNTGMCGYQEVLTDPSYCGQLVTMTYPLIGNYGVNAEDIESDRVQVSAFIVKEYQAFASNYRATETLADYLARHHILGVEQLDTRALTRHIRNAGAMRACISTRTLTAEQLIARAQASPAMAGLDLVCRVSATHAYRWENGQPQALPLNTALNQTIWRRGGRTPRVAVLDFGIKYNILRCLEAQGMELIVLPAHTPADTLMALAPDGLFLSNGPGDPEPVRYAIDTIARLIGFRPIFGICLGHQLLGLALGAQTYKLKFGHRGANQPVKHLKTGRVEITSQNHGFAVSADSLSQPGIELSHINLNDNTVEGFRYPAQGLLSVQFHPEAAPGPHDAAYLFQEFRNMMGA